MGLHGINDSKIPLKDKIGFGTGDMAYGIITQMVGTYIVFYSNAVLGIPGSLVGFAVSISVMWDAISDPLMGYLSDSTRSERFGKRHLYILIGIISIAISNFLLWSIDHRWPTMTKFSALLFCLLLLKTAITVYATPYSALGAELTTDYNDRTSIQGIRTIFFLVGLMSATVMGFFVFFNPTDAYPVGQQNPDAYLLMGGTVSLIALTFGLVAFFSTRKYLPRIKKLHTSDPEKVSFLKIFSSIRLAMTNRNYRLIVIAYLLTNISTAIISSLGIHVFTYTFKLGNNGIGIIFGVLFSVSILSLPVWVKISKKIDKKATVITGIAFSLCGCLMLLIYVIIKDSIAGNVLALLPFSAVAGFGSGALISLPYSMIADTIDVDELKTGVRLEGVYYGTLTFFYKFSQAFTIFLIGILLDLIRFDASAAVQPEKTVLTLGFTITGVGFLVLTLAAFTYMKYDLTRKKIADVQEQIDARQKSNGCE
ncbi:MAG: MFS transporter [Saccharofermentanales bacterium]